MSREAEIAAKMIADATLMAILTGGVYVSGVIGLDGIRRGDHSLSNAAFGGDGFLLPCALVKDRAPVDFGGIRDEAEVVVSISQVVEIYFYEDRGHTAIYAAKERTFSILANPANRLTGAYPSTWMLETKPLPDVGPLKGNTTLRQDWQIISLRRG